MVWPEELPPGQFDYNREMRQTRLRVDELLAEGKVEEAEAYMEERRQLFVEQGHSLVGLCDLQPNAAVADAVQAAGAQVHTAPGAWLAEADVVVSAVFGTVARSLFEACLPHLRHLREGVVYVDMTTADPQEMRECGELARRVRVLERELVRLKKPVE